MMILGMRIAISKFGGGDTTPPTLTSATINAAGNRLTLVFDEAVTGGTGFTLSGAENSFTNTYLSGDGTNTLILVPDNVVLSTEGDPVSLGYSSGNVTDLIGNALADIVGFNATNNSAVPDSTFTVDNEAPPIFETITFTASSLNSPTTHLWECKINAGAWGAFLEQSTDAAPIGRPNVMFSETIIAPDVVSIRHTASNASGTGPITTRLNYITITEE